MEELSEEGLLFLERIGLSTTQFLSFEETMKALETHEEHPKLRRILRKNAIKIKKEFEKNKKELKKYLKKNFNFIPSFNEIKLNFNVTNIIGGRYEPSKKAIIINLLKHDKNALNWTIAHELLHYVFANTNFKHYLRKVSNNVKEEDVKIVDKLCEELLKQREMLLINHERIFPFIKYYQKFLPDLSTSYYEIKKGMQNIETEILSLYFINSMKTDLYSYSTNYEKVVSSIKDYLKNLFELIEKEIKFLKKIIKEIIKFNEEQSATWINVLKKIIINYKISKRITHKISDKVNELINPLIERAVFNHYFPLLFEEGFVETLTYLYLKERGFKERILLQKLSQSAYSGNIKMIKILSKEVNLNKLIKQVFKEENKKKNEELINLAIKASHALIISESIKESKKFQELKKKSEETSYSGK